LGKSCGLRSLLDALLLHWRKASNKLTAILLKRSLGNIFRTGVNRIVSGQYLWWDLHRLG
jgi:hypothetical protein